MERLILSSDRALPLGAGAEVVVPVTVRLVVVDDGGGVVGFTMGPKLRQREFGLSSLKQKRL